MKLQYYTKTVYGVERLYFADNRIANAFYALTQRKSFERNDINWFSQIFGQEVQLERVFAPSGA